MRIVRKLTTSSAVLPTDWMRPMGNSISCAAEKALSRSARMSPARGKRLLRGWQKANASRAYE